MLLLALELFDMTDTVYIFACFGIACALLLFLLDMEWGLILTAVKRDLRFLKFMFQFLIKVE